MASYKVLITASVQKYLDKLSDAVADKLEGVMMKLEAEPRPVKCLEKTLIEYGLETTELFTLYKTNFYW